LAFRVNPYFNADLPRKNYLGKKGLTSTAPRTLFDRFLSTTEIQGDELIRGHQSRFPPQYCARHRAAAKATVQRKRASKQVNGEKILKYNYSQF